MIDRRTFLSLPLTLAVPLTTRAQTAPTAVIAPFATVAVANIDVAWREMGSGEPLFMVQGLGGTMDQWDPTLLPLLAETYRVITFDNRGIGGTSGPGPYHFRQLADDVVGLMDALGVERAHVFGWSLGAMITQDLVIRHRERVARAVLHAGDPGGASAILPSPDMLGMLADTGGDAAEQRQRKIALFVPAAWAATHSDYLTMVFSRPSAPVSAEAIGWQVQALIERYQQEHALATIQTPTLILHGTDDLVIPVSNAQLLADAIPGSWLIRLPGGHGVQYQYPQGIARLLGAFLNAED